MKLYCELNDLQKDFAIDASVKNLVEKLINEDFDYQFKSSIAQKHFHDALLLNSYEDTEYAILGSDEIAEELYDAAITIAECAFYAQQGEMFFYNVA